MAIKKSVKKKVDMIMENSIDLFQDQDNKKRDSRTFSVVDKGLVAMFLRMSPEERLLANDNAVRAIMELRNAFRRQKTGKSGSQCDP